MQSTESECSQVQQATGSERNTVSEQLAEGTPQPGISLSNALADESHTTAELPTADMPEPELNFLNQEAMNLDTPFFGCSWTEEVMNLDVPFFDYQ